MRGNKPSMLENQKFGRLTVLRRSTKADRSGSVFWICKCDCGNEVAVRSDLLKRLHTQSCGCLKKEAVSAALKLAKTTHGFTNTVEYRIWKGIKSRCSDPNNQAYHLYGGNGITICDEWKDDFMAFYNDMGPRPSLYHSIDRKENDKGYSKDNCRWATHIEQANNRTNNRRFKYGGEERTLADWCRHLKLNRRLIYSRISRGWTFEEAIQPAKTIMIDFEGETKSLYEWCSLMGMDYDKTYLRVIRGESFDSIVRE